MFAMKDDRIKLLPVAIMAHNEEKVVERAVKSALNQNTPAGYSVKVVVVANGCTDRTEEIVCYLEQQHPNKVSLISIPDKGKTKAINKAIQYFKETSDADAAIPYVVFLDADCDFLGSEVLCNFIKHFEQNPNLCAVSSHCLPDVCVNSRQDIVAEIYRTIYQFGNSLKINSISGGGYCIRLDILEKMDFPDFQFAEDMFISSRLNGWFLRDKNINILFETPSNIRGEIRRKTRQEISAQRYHQYYAYLKKKGIRVELFDKPLGDDYRWVGATDDNIGNVLLRLKGLKSKLLVVTYLLIRVSAKVQALFYLRKIGKLENIDYWEVSR